MRTGQMLGQGQPVNAVRGTPSQSDAYVAYDFYTYEEDFTALVSGSSAQGSINIQADSDFVLQKLCYFADIAGAAQTNDSRVVPLVTLQIVDAGSGRQLFEAPAPVNSVFGYGALPFILPRPRVFFARSTVDISVANFSAATDYDLRLSFIGYKAYPA